jgi:NAD(P)-dependent dehydrogenase (short-subunit alcohol dehydrogenase family)
MNLGLQGKIAVVSGSTAGIGLAIAAALAAEGADSVMRAWRKLRTTKSLAHDKK